MHTAQKPMLRQHVKGLRRALDEAKREKLFEAGCEHVLTHQPESELAAELTAIMSEGKLWPTDLMDKTIQCYSQSQR